MAVFDVDAWLEAQEPWTVKLGRRTYRAEPVSVLAVLRFYRAVEEGKTGADADAAYVRAVEALLREAFPYRWRWIWRGDPVRRILGLDPAVQQAVLRDFFEWAARRVAAQIQRTTPGSALPSKTPPPSNSPASTADAPSP